MRAAIYATGWVYVLSSNKMHYFVNGRTLCGLWRNVRVGRNPVERAPHAVKLVGDCGTCWSKARRVLGSAP